EQNDRYLQEAVTYYKKAAEVIEEPKLRKLSYEYLLASYGQDKLNDPSQAEPIVKKMIELEPDDPANYFALAKIYEDAGNYEEAEATLLKARDVQPRDSSVYLQLAAYYNRQGQFDRTIEALEQRASIEPDTPEAYYTIATFLWDKSFRDARLRDAEKRDYIQKGLAAVDKALEIKPDYLEAIVYKGLLLRLQANLERNPARQQELLKQADALRDKAKELQKAKQVGSGA